jgi:hypothetical protein
MAGLDRNKIGLAALILLAGLAPVVEEVNTLSLIVLFLALGLSLSHATNPDLDSPGRFALALRDLFLIGPFRFFRDAIGVFSLPGIISRIAVWLVPLTLGSVFVLLFGTANPVIEKWIAQMIPSDGASPISVDRLLFWTAATMFVWPFIQIWWRRKPASPSAEPVLQAREPATRPSPLFRAASILRSLILFNLLFAVQTALDLIYLWGNVELPPGITYASYAHDGAYALILTALLAAGFVLAAMRPGGPAERSQLTRPLVYLWVAQNILLVASSILRLDLYVQIYLLTYWRVAAFIWMLLVALGLVLIVARIVLERPNSWLIRANLIALTAVLYACSLTNFASIIADYNVTHSREASGNGVTIDMSYLFQLGPQALPAIDKAMQLRGFDSFLRDCIAKKQAGERLGLSWLATLALYQGPPRWSSNLPTKYLALKYWRP